LPNKIVINESALSKGELRKLNALRKSLGEIEGLAERAFNEWYENRPKGGAAAENDPVAEIIESALGSYANDKKFNLGRRGYTIFKAKGRGQKGIKAVRND